MKTQLAVTKKGVSVPDLIKGIKKPGEINGIKFPIKRAPYLRSLCSSEFNGDSKDRVYSVKTIKEELCALVHWKFKD